MQNQYHQKIIKISHLIKHLQNKFPLFLIVICMLCYRRTNKKWENANKIIKQITHSLLFVEQTIFNGKMTF